MRFVANKKAIPRTWSRIPTAGGIVAEADIFPNRRGRLAAKLLIFDKPASLRRFWKEINPSPLGRSCLGVVNVLAHVVHPFPDGKPAPKFLRGDPRYFCVIGLCAGHLTMEVIAHEAVHAGFAYEKRAKRNIFAGVDECDEERVAYPAGRIAAAINRFIHQRKLY